MGAILLIHSS